MFDVHGSLRGAVFCLALGFSLAGCGGDSADPPGPAQAEAAQAQATAARTEFRAASLWASPSVVTDAGTPTMSSAEAFRFLSQASFGPTPASVDGLRASTYEQWIDGQIAMPWRKLQPRVQALYQDRLAGNGKAIPDRGEVVNEFWREILTHDAQLRWRVAYALSQTFVFSLSGSIGLSDPFGAANYIDMLAGNALGSYRQLLERVALHPAMGRYLSHLGNRPADELTGRVPDENFAREVMQLFSIGMYQLNVDGSLKLDGKSRPIATYDADDVAGMARVFTGWSWDCSTGRNKQCFTNWFQNIGDPYVGTRPMVAYADYHSTEEKRFLGVVIPAQPAAQPQVSLKIALDTLANHPNVGPFISRQLIQRLVTSNPSPAYIAAVASVFNNNGKGVRGDLAAVVRKILTHSEARTAGAHQGKVREPVLLLSALARAIPVKSLTGKYKVRDVEDYDLALGQVPMWSPSVFNFYRPGYVARGGGLVSANMVAPEMQIVDENSVASYVRFMRRALEGGFGTVTYAGSGVPDMQLDVSALAAVAKQPAVLVDKVFEALLGDADHASLRAEIEPAVASINVPALNQKRTNQEGIERAKVMRARMALLLVLASPEFIVQR